MKLKACMRALLIAAGAALTLQVQAATVVDFEGLPPGTVADGYSGITGWSSLGNLGVGVADLAAGGLAYYGHDGVIRFQAGAVRFDGTLYKSYAVPDGTSIQALELWYHGQLVHSLADPRAPLDMLWLASGYAGPVDEIRLHGGIEGFGIDNFTYSAAPVPEPATGLTLAAGLALLVARGRVRRGRA